METSRPQDGVAARPNAFSVLMAGQAAHSHALQIGQLPKRKDVEQQPPSKWLASLQLRDRLAGEKKLGFIGGTAQNSGKGVHWKVCQRSSSKFWSLHGLRENGDEECPQTSTLSEFIDCTP